MIHRQPTPRPAVLALMVLALAGCAPVPPHQPGDLPGTRPATAPTPPPAGGAR